MPSPMAVISCLFKKDMYLSLLKESMLLRRYFSLPFVRVILNRSFSIRASFLRVFRVLWSWVVRSESFILSWKCSNSPNMLTISISSYVVMYLV